MKQLNVTLLIVGLAAIAIADTPREHVLTRVWRGDGNEKVWVVTDQRIKAAPAWDGLTNEPPVSPSKAANIAAAYIAKQQGLKQSDLRPLKISLDSLMVSPNISYWVYKIHLFIDTHGAPSATSGDQDPMMVVILMDGSVVEPKEQKRQAVEPPS